MNINTTLQINVHSVAVPLWRVVVLDGGIDLETGLPVQRNGGRPCRVDVEGHPLDPPLHGGRQQRLAVSLTPAALLHCDHQTRVAALGHGLQLKTESES
jgi:hypothetical protein